MAINYERLNNGAGWDTQTSLGPTNLNHMEQGIKEACDAIDIDCLQVGETTPIGEYVGTTADFATKAQQTESGKNIDNEFDDIKATLSETLPFKNYGRVSNVDLNNYTETGVVVYVNADATTITNRPIDKGTTVTVLNLLKSGGGVYQFATDRTYGNLTNVFIRHLQDNGWSPWVEFTTNKNEDTWKAGDVWDLPASGAFAGIISGTNAYISIQSTKKIQDNVKIALSDFELQSTPMLATTNGSKTNLTVDNIVVLGDRRTIRFRIANLSGVTTSTPCTYWGGFKITFS